MQTVQPQNDVSIDDVIVRGNLAARRIADDLSWGVGAIQPQTNDADAGRELVGAVLDSIAEVNEDETEYSSCTDGRLPVQLMSGEKIPVREQVVGADMVSAFYIAESLGDRFYRDPSAPVADRVIDVAEFLHENGLLPSSHIACGAAGSFAGITENVVRFSQDPNYILRLRELLPQGVFDADLHVAMVQANQQRLQAHAYDDLTGEIFLAAAQKVGGTHAIAELKDDSRGVHGHVEEAIMRIRVPGEAIDQTTLANKTNGRQVFGVNDDRMERLARLFARGNDQDYRIAAMALEDFASSGHATLAKNLPTYIVTSV